MTDDPEGRLIPGEGGDGTASGPVEGGESRDVEQAEGESPTKARVIAGLFLVYGAVRTFVVLFVAFLSFVFGAIVGSVTMLVSPFFWFIPEEGSGPFWSPSEPLQGTPLDVGLEFAAAVLGPVIALVVGPLYLVVAYGLFDRNRWGWYGAVGLMAWWFAVEVRSVLRGSDVDAWLVLPLLFAVALWDEREAFGVGL